MIGTKLAHYVVTSHLGSGGMGEVYQATDTKLGRSVAIKVLPAAFASDTDHLSRFRREAHLLASLNHPNIAAIYGLEEDGGFRFLILELVEGETLAERLKRGPIPLDEALRTAKQIAEALEAAHEKGIIHRDLKPANIKLTDAGAVKVLDFGLAKALEVDRDAASPNAATMMMTATRPGMILGTPAYMSPEQASGKDTERTSDVWAFGCVLYEMFTGHRVFEGETVTEILSNVMKAEPDWTRLPDDTPDGIRRLLRRCLQKERRSRLHDIADARIEIEETQSAPRAKEHAAVISKWSFARVAGITALVVGLAGAFVAAGFYFRGTIDKTAERRFEISLPQTAGAFAVSPDGSKFVFVNTTEGQSRLWLRSLLDLTEEAKPMAGTEGVIGSPFWSPDSQSIGFFPGNALKRIDVIGGSVRNLESESSPDLKGSRDVLIFSAPTGAWGQNDAIVFAPNADTPLYRVPEKGGWGVPMTRLDRPRQLAHLSPQFLPDGHHFLFYADGPAEGRGVYIGSLESPDARRLFDADGPAVFMPPDYLLFIRQGALYAQRFDTLKLVPADEPILVAQQAASVSAAAGVIAYRPPATGEPKFTWFDRTGKSLGAVGESLIALGDGGASLSPDDRLLAMHRAVHANIDVWLLDLIRGGTQKLTEEPLVEGFPIWSPDSKFVGFLRSISGTEWDLYVKPADGVSAETLLLSEPSKKRVLDWSPDGRSILFVRNDHLYALPVTPDGKPDGKPIPLTDANKNSVEGQGQFSPDGRWIVYQSNQTGRNEIYLQPFLRPGQKRQVTTEGGTDARWPRKNKDKELFYVAPGNKLMAVPVALSADGQRPVLGTPTPIAPNLRMQTYYNVSSNGQRILMNAPTGEPKNPPVTVIFHWKPPPK